MRICTFVFLFMLANTVFAQSKISGNIMSMETGKPLNGIEVKLKNLVSVPVYSNEEGLFEIEIPTENVVLEFAYAGYKNSTKFVSAGSTISVYMVKDNEYSVEDEVSMPFGKVKDKHTTGSKALIGSKDLGAILSPSIESRISGLAAGVRVLSNSGSPGSGSTLLIRGISTLNGGTQPLYVVDGLVLRNYQYSNPLSAGANHNPLTDINPNDIRSVNVIKDGAQSAFYGMKGANGVVLIETNMGTSGKTSLYFDAYTGISTLPSRIPVLNAHQYKSYFKDLNYKNGMTPIDFGETFGKVFYEDPNSINYSRYNNNNNWQDIITESGVIQNYYLNLKGGDQVTTYAFSAGYLNQEGAVAGTNLQRFTINFNLIYRISDKMRFGNVVNFGYTDKKLADEGLNYHSNPLFISLIKAPQFAPNVQSNDGTVSLNHEDQDFFGMSNPVHVTTDLENTARLNRLMGSIYLEMDVLKDLTGRIEMGVDYNRQTEKRFYPDYGLSTSENAVRFSEGKVNNRFLIQGDAYLMYNKTINNVHNIKVLAGAGVYNQKIDFTYGKSINSAADYFTTLAKGDADSISSGLTQTNMVAAYSKINYSYKERILLQANLRVDGSSRFSKQNRYGYFPGISAGWRLSEESFLSDINFINELKLKVGYGVTGNENIEDFAVYNTYSGGSYNLRGAINPYNLGNKELKWETTKQNDIGIHFLGARNRIGAEIDFYQKKTTDLFYFRHLPSITGYSGIIDNLGDIENKGVDVNLFVRPLNRKFVWDSRFTFSIYKNVVTKLPGGEFSASSDQFIGMAREGEPIGIFYGYEAVGIFETNEEASQYQNTPGYGAFQAGDIKFADHFEDGIIDSKDMVIIGNPHPDFYGSFLNTFSYKGIKFDLNLTYSVGNEAVNTTRSYLESMSNHYNQTTAVLQAWRREGDAQLTNVPRIAMGDPSGNARNSSRWVEDASYLRVQLLSLSYDIPKKLLDRVGLNSLNVYAKGQNLYTFSKYLGYSPEFINGYNPLFYGIDTGSYPNSRTVLLGVKIGL